jgi:hypothetical protein
MANAALAVVKTARAALPGGVDYGTGDRSRRARVRALA